MITYLLCDYLRCQSMPYCKQCLNEFSGNNKLKFCSLICTLDHRSVDGCNGCINFTGVPAREYGSVRFRGREIRANRAMWEHHNGPIPKGLVVRHKCDNKRCCNIEHLELGTPNDNVQDAVTRGRHAKGTSMASAKLTENDIKPIRELIAKNIPPRIIGLQFGVSRAAIRHIKDGTSWKHV